MKSKQFSLFRLYRQEAFLLLVACLTVTIFVPLFTYLYFAKDLTSKESIMNRNDTGLILLDRNGEVFFRFYEAKYKPSTPLKNIPEHARQSVIVAEDRRFYQHPGFSVPSILAAIVANIKHNELSYGGSTITQQLVKSSLLTPRKSILRKYQEVILAYELERRYSKDEILEMYLNSVYFGEGAFGISAAADTYFAAPVQKLSLAQASMLAGLLTAPSIYSPLSSGNENGKQRQDYVLTQMVEEGYIDKKEKEQALREQLSYAYKKENKSVLAPHFALMVRDILITQFGEEEVARSGFIIHTTLDLTMQKVANDIVYEEVEALMPRGATNAAVVVIDPNTGKVLVLTGSKDWFNEQFGKVNMAITPRQSGSSFKPIVYAHGFEKGIITPATQLRDQKTTFPGNYTPQNYDRSFRGIVLVRRALANSLNVPSVRVLQSVGISDTLDFAKSLGISTLGGESEYGLSLVLGTGAVRLTELTNAYAVFANGGVYHQLTYITRIQDKNGKIVYEYMPKGKRVLKEGAAFLITSILSDNRARAEEFGNVLTISRPAAVKTGTTEDYKDALTLGYTPDVVIGVWVGNNDNTPMDRLAGSLGAAPLWKRLMEQYHRGQPVKQFTPPRDVVKLAICRNNGYLLAGNISTSSATMEYFLKSSTPVLRCTFRTLSPKASPPPPVPPTS